ncbi:MAG: hypothetical protein KF861_19130, partial [Planctomycetaceae bacterium]|nr:hypothetical protein [Planctomycetaceae bacterium]
MIVDFDDVRIAAGTLTLSELATAMDAALEAAIGRPLARTAVTFDGEDRISIADPTFDGDDEPIETFRIAAIDGARIAFTLGLSGRDDAGDGVIEGSALHGESIADRMFVQDATFSAAIDAAARVDATAHLGFVKVGVQDGQAGARAEISLTLQDPATQANDGRIFLSELLGVGIDLQQALDSVRFSGSVNLSLPVVLQETITGLSLPGAPRIVATWADITRPETLALSFTDLDPVLAFQGFSLSGLTRETPLSALNQGEGVRIIAGQAELRLQLRDGRTVDINLDGARTVGDVIEKFRTALDSHPTPAARMPSKVVVEIGPTGQNLVLRDLNVNLGGTFSVQALAGSAASDLGLTIADAADGRADGVITGSTIFGSSIYAALGQLGRFLTDLEHGSALAQVLPLFETAIADLLGFGNRVQNAFGAIGDGLDRLKQELQWPSGPDSLQSLEELLEALLDHKLGVSNNNVTLRLEGNVLRLDMAVDHALNKELNLNFDLQDGSLGRLLDARGQARIPLELAAALQVSVGIDLSNPDDIRPFLFSGDTQFNVTARAANITPIQLTAALGPFGVFIRNGQVVLDRDGAGPSQDPASFRLTLTDDNSDGRIYLNELISSVFSYADIQAEWGAHANLPVFFPTDTASIGSITATASSASPLPVVTLPSFPNIDLGLNLGAFVDGWDGLFSLVGEALDGEVLGIKLPLIGDQLQQAGWFIDSLRTMVTDAVSPEQLNSANAVALLQQVLFAGLGDLENNFPWLGDTNNDGSAGNLSDIVVRVDHAAVNPQTYNPLTNPVNQNIEFEMLIDRVLGQTSAVNFNLDLSALPGLGIEVQQAGIVFETFFKFRVTIGVDVNNGVYFRFDTSQTEDVALGIRATLPSGFHATGRLGFLQLDITDNGTLFEGAFRLDLQPSAADGRVFLNDIFTGGLGIDGGFTTTSSLVSLGLKASFGGNAAFPQIRTALNIDFPFENASSSSGGTISGFVPEISFDDVEINFGSFLSDFLGPTVRGMNDVLAPVRPVLDVLTAPLPVISELGGPVSMVDLARVFGYADVADFVDAANDLSNLVKKLNTLVGGV